MTEATTIDLAQERMEHDISSLSSRYNLVESDIRRYAESMLSGNLKTASTALHDIRGQIRGEHSNDSFKEFLQRFIPVREELYERFGNMDELRKDAIDTIMEERTGIEVARQQIENEAAAEKVRLQEFRDMGSHELDNEYFKSIKENNEPRMRDLVNEVARRNGYVSGNEFRMAHRAPGYDESGVDKNLVDLANNKDQTRDSLNGLLHRSHDKANDESVTAINEALARIDRGESPSITVYRTVPRSLKEGKIRNGDWVSLSEGYAKMHGEHALSGDYRIMKEEVPADNLYWDGNDINEWGYDDRSDYRYKDTKNNRKLNAPVTHDDKGEIIPLSERFNSFKENIRYRFIGEKGAANLDMAEEGAARLDNLAVAGDMEAAGKDAQTVKPVTGWERGSDRLWRYEEPDLILRDVLLQKDTNGQIVVPLQEIIRDENLFNAYPFLKGTVVAEDYGTGEGFYNEATNTIGLNTKKFIPVKSNSNEGLISELQSKLEELESYPEVRAFNRMFESGQANDVTKIDSFLEEHPNAKKYSELEDKLWDLCHDKKIIGYRVTDRATIVHEVQHVIQSLEGFARGGSAEEFKDTRTDVVRDLNFSTDGRLLKGHAISDSRSIRLALDKKVPYTDINLTEGYHKQLQQVARKYGYADIENLIDNFDGMPTAREQYHKLAGEVEARNAESRMDLTPEDRRSTLSVTTEDVAREHQTILAYTKERMELAGYASSLAEKQHIPASIITSPDDIPSKEIRRLIAGKADIRGWYDVPSDRVCLYLPNATGKADIGRTLLHEGVAHYGLRKTIGNENMNRFLDDVYAGADGQIRRDIQTIASSRSLNVREATEEYLANLAEHDATPGFRGKVRQFLTDILRAMGFNIQLKNSDLESILSKSKANLQCIPPKGNDTSLFFKGGRREITINSGKAVIRTNGNEYDAAAILKSLKKANVDIKGISAGQWEKMLKGQGTVLDPERPGTLFSIQKQSCGYGIRVVSVDLQSAKGVQNEI